MRALTMTERKTITNSTFSRGGISCSEYSFVVAESSVLGMNICAEKLAHRKSANHYKKSQKTTKRQK